jgi:two-component system, NarL family, invasion response regulator UvrY
MEQKLRILICDDHPVLVSGLVATMRSHPVEVVGQVSDSTLIVDAYRELSPDVVVLDIAFAIGAPTGLEIAGQLRKLDAASRIVIYSQFDTDEFIKEAYRLKCSAFVTKNTSFSVLMEAIQRAYQGRPYFLPDVAERLAVINYGGDDSPRTKLDDREFDVFKRVARGDVEKEICAELQLSPRTIQLITKSIKQKLGVQRVAALTLLAVKYGVIAP